MFTMDYFTPVFFIISLFIAAKVLKVPLFNMFAALGLLWLAVSFKDKDIAITVGLTLMSVYGFYMTWRDAN